MTKYAHTLYMPYITSSYTLEKLVNVIENELHLGEVGRMECIPKINATNGKRYHSCFVYFNSYEESRNCDFIYETIRNVGEQARVYLPDGTYLIFSENVSDLRHTVEVQPKHMDLTFTVHQDVHLRTIHNLMSGLDLGFIHNIEDHGFLPDDSPNPDLRVWPHVNRAHWDEFTQTHMRTVVVRYAYWYRTRSATSFQEIMETGGCVRVPAMNGTVIWTLFPKSPLMSGVNPYVWEREVKPIMM